jgi:hypothetical protein
MNPNMSRVRIVIATGCLALATVALWLWLHPVTPIDTPYFNWRPSADDRYELLVNHVGGNPEFRQGVTTTPVPQSGLLRVSGGPGSAEPGAIVEVSNTRTRRGYAVPAGADGAFSVVAETRRGDTLKVITRRIRFRPLEPPRYDAVLATP